MPTVRTFPGWTMLALIAFVASDASIASAATKPLAEVPFKLHQNGIIVEATINGEEKVHLLLDTGWGPLALVSTTAERLNLHPEGAGDYPRVTVGSLAVGGAIQRNASFEVFPTAELEGLIGPNDGVLSTAFFKNLVLQVDYPARIVRFYARAPIAALQPAEASTRATVPMVFSPRAGALPFTDAVLVDGKPVRALFDTGGSGGFMAMRQLIDRAHLEALPDSASNVRIGMLSDGKMAQAKMQFAKVGRIELGPFAVDAPRVIMAPAQLEGDNWGHDLNIGYGFLRNYIVTFDYPGKLITFQRPQ